MTRYLVILCLFAGLSMLSCGHPTMDLMFNTSTQAYPVSSDSSAAAMESIGGNSSGLTVTSVVKISMKGIAEAKMQSVWLQSLTLRAQDGDLRFIQFAKCYVQARDGSSQIILLGQAKAENVSEDGRSIKFQVDSGPDLAGILRSPFNIVVEIEGDSPTGKVNTFAELTFKAHVQI